MVDNGNESIVSHIGGQDVCVHEYLEYARSITHGEFTLNGLEYSGEHTIITQQCNECGQYKQQILLGRF